MNAALLLLLAAAEPAGKAIDDALLAAAREAKVAVGPAAPDATIVRRLHLDLLGRVPTPAEAKACLDDRRPDRHGRLGESLLAHPEMPAYWALVLDGWMNERGGDRKAFVAWLEKALAADRPWDRIARALLLPDGADEPASHFLGSRLGKGSKEDKLDGMTVAVASTLYGVRLECAKCHDHPYVPEWKQKHYYGLGAFLTRTDRAGAKGLAEKGSGDLTYQDRERRLHKATMLYLDGREGDSKAASRRKALADLTINAANPAFRRALANRVWKKLMGVGLVEPVDQIHDGNPPAHPAILDHLADGFARDGFSIRKLIRAILSTDAYRRSSAWTGRDRPRDGLHAVAVLRPLSPEQLALSVMKALDHDPRGDRDKELKLFIDQFDGDGDRFTATTPQALFLTFGKATRKYFSPARGLLARMVKAGDGEAARLAYEAILSRPPTADEAATAAEYLRGGGTRVENCRDLAWALLASAEFRFNH